MEQFLTPWACGSINPNVTSSQTNPNAALDKNFKNSSGLDIMTLLTINRQAQYKATQTLEPVAGLVFFLLKNLTDNLTDIRLQNVVYS